jgi:hypothetical protein
MSIVAFQALNLFTTALGSWLMIPLVFLVNSGLFGSPWITENLDDGHLAYYFFFLTAIMFVNQVCGVSNHPRPPVSSYPFPYLSPPLPLFPSLPSLAARVLLDLRWI